MTRFVAFLRAVNVSKSRRVSMPAVRAVLEELRYADVTSYANTGNLPFTATGRTADHEPVLRAALERRFGIELITFVRTAKQVVALASDQPFGEIAPGHTHFALLTLNRMTAKEKRAVEALSNEHDEVVVIGRDVHWLIRSRSPQTTLGPRRWQDALPANPTTARNTTLLARLIEKL
jgi:uncharacterized protein (DUF1697 family)